MKITNILQALLLVLVLLCPKLAAQTYPPGYIPTTPCPARGYNPSFDWTVDYYDFYLETSNAPNGYKQMQSPWVNYYDNNNMGAFRYTGEANYAPKYGWRLVKYDFGAPPSNNTPARKINHPYLILYNQWRGIMRIFTAISVQQGSAADKCMFLVQFPNEQANTTPYKSGIFEFNRASNGFNALDKFDNQIPVMQTVNEYSYNLPYWVYTDIATAYDPCTCNYNSFFNFDVKLVSTATLQFTANGNVVQQINGSGGGSGGRQNLLNVAIGAGKAGTSYYNDANSAISTIAGIFGATVKSPFLKNWLPGFSAAAGVVDFLSGVFGVQTPPQPMAFKMDLKATGTLETILPHKQQNPDVPGSRPQGRPLIPVHYDNPLGVYNLLETPKAYTTYQNVDNGYLILGESVALRIPDNIKYVINPNAEIDMSKFDIYGAIEVEVGLNNPAFPNSGGAFYPNLFKVKDLSPGVQLWRTTTYPLGALKNVVVELFSVPDYTYQNNLRIIKSFVRITLKHKRTVGNENMEEIHIGRFNTNLLNYPTNVTDPIQNDPFFNPPNRTELQSMKDTEVIGTFWIPGISFPQVIDVPVGEIKTIYATRSLRVGTFIVTGGGKVRFLTGTPSDTDPNRPNIDFIDAMAVVYFTGALNNGELILEVGVPDLINIKLPPVADGEKEKPITAFCNSNVYINRAKNFEATQNDDMADNATAASKAEVFTTSLSIFPNPAATQATFQYAVANKGEVRIVLTNTLGITVQEIVSETNHEKGKFEVTLPTEQLPSGVYVCTLHTTEGVQTQKLVVSK